MHVKQCCRITLNGEEVAFYESKGERFTVDEILAMPKLMPGYRATYFMDFGVDDETMRQAVEILKSSRGISN